MNFFEHQDQARRKTLFLIVLLSLAVLVLISLTIIAAGIILPAFSTSASSIDLAQAAQGGLIERIMRFAFSAQGAWIAIAVISVVAAGSLYKYAQIKRGGKYVAEKLDASPVNTNTRDFYERRLLNIVEEMAIASGNPVPAVYVLDDTSINAFAAGNTNNDAVIGITTGCMTLLNREELQGVVAHEFSHIHNGDMRLNMRILAILNGILLIGTIGYTILRSGTHANAARSRNDDNKGAGAVALFGLALLIIGYGGTFFGNLIKAAVSRQREFLADASAVQFTRSPRGISQALQKIGGHHEKAMLKETAAAEFSHLYFAQGISTLFNSFMATHPPLDKRIQAVDKGWSGKFITPDYSKIHEEYQYDKNKEVEAGSGSNVKKGLDKLERVIDVAAVGASAATILSPKQDSKANLENSPFEQAIENAGEPDERNVAAAKTTIGRIDDQLRDAAHEPFSARAVVYCLFLDFTNITVRQQQIQGLKQRSHPQTYSDVLNYHELVLQIARRERLTLLSLCLPALRDMSHRQYDVFKENLLRLISADQRVSLFEWSYFQIIVSGIEETRIRESRRLSDLQTEASLLLRVFTQADGDLIESGEKDAERRRKPENGSEYIKPIYNGQKTHADREAGDMQAAFDAGLDVLKKATRVSYLDMRFTPATPSMNQLSSAINELKALRPLEKPMLLKAIAAIVKHDGKVTQDEYELFRATADSLNCPIPPLTV